MNAKIERVSKDIQKTKDKISEFQTRLRELEKQKTELENTEIVEAVRGMDISLADLAATSGQVGPKSDPDSMCRYRPRPAKKNSHNRESRAWPWVAEHEADIAAYRAAGATMNRLLNGGKLPKMDTLKAEFQKLAADKKAAYREYRAAKKEMQEVIAAKANIDHLLGLTGGRKNKEMER